MPVKLIMTSCQSAADMIAIHGIDKELFTKFHEYEMRDEDLKAFKGDRAGALVGRRIAARYGWQPGMQVTLDELDGISFNIDGLFSSGGSRTDYLILVGRRFLQEATSEQGISNHVLVRLKPGVDPVAASAAIDALPLTIATTTRAEEAYLAEALDQLADLVAVSMIVVGVILAVILFALGNAISMATRERTGEFAVMRTLGYPRRSILSLVLLEGMVQAALGGAVGCLAVWLVLSGGWVKAVSTCGITVALNLGLSIWLIGPAIIIGAGAFGSLIPAWNASRLEIVTALRRED